MLNYNYRWYSPYLFVTVSLFLLLVLAYTIDYPPLIEGQRFVYFLIPSLVFSASSESFWDTVEDSSTVSTTARLSFAQLHQWHKYRRNIPHPLRPSSIPSPLSGTSSVQCTGSLNDYSGALYRSCILRNVCYNKPTNQWTYYVGNGNGKIDTVKQHTGTNHHQESGGSTSSSGGSSSIFAIPVRFDSDFGMVSSLSYRSYGIVSDTMELQDYRYPIRENIQPTISLDPYPFSPRTNTTLSSSSSTTTVELSQFIQLWYPNQHLFYDCNIGHLLWDWSTSLLYNRIILGLGNGKEWNGGIGDKEYRRRITPRIHSEHGTTIGRLRVPFSTVTDKLSTVDDIAVLLTEEFPRFSHVPDALGLEHPLCRKTIPVIQPSIELNTIQHTLELLGRSYGDGKPLTNICFRNVAVGGYHYHIQPFPMAQGYSLTNIGQENQFLVYRNSILSSHGIAPSSPLPSQHQIILIKKSTAFTNTEGQTVRRSIENIDEAYGWLQNIFPSLATVNRIQIIEPHKLSWRQQLNLLIDTTILITPCGGISTILPFLPFGATVIIMDYPEPLHNRSVSMESILWNHFPYLRILYYQIYTEKDYRLIDTHDLLDNGRPNYRHNTVNILERTRLLSLVYSAMKYMT